jgi:Ser/Thr protein kinase RdoA (MazF antagonist)
MNSPLTAYGQLTPDTVLEALDAVGLRGDGRILQLNSYENRVFRLMLEDGGAVVAKFYRPGRWSDAQIHEEHAFTLELAAAEVAVMAPLPMKLLPPAAPNAQVSGPSQTLLHWQPADGGAHRISVSPWLGGRDPDIETPEAFERLGRLIGRVHAVGSSEPFAHRLTLEPALGQQAIDTLLALQVVDPGLQSRWEGAARQALEAVARAFERSAGAPLLRLHGDAHRGNLLERDQTLHLVDFDDACNGPAMQDLWLFLDGQDGEDRRRQLQALLRGYEDFMDFDDAQIALIEPLRTLRLLRHSAWIAQRWSDPAFPIAFPGFGTPNHWADQTVLLQEQIDRMA